MRPKNAEISKAVPVKLDKALQQRIESLAGKIGEAKSVVMRMAMRIGLDALEKAFEASPADLLKIINAAQTPKNLSTSSSDGAKGAAENRVTVKPKRPAA